MANLFALALVCALFWKRRELIEAIDNFRNNFPRGGPRTPMHPLPANDGALVGRKQPGTD